VRVEVFPTRLEQPGEDVLGGLEVPDLEVDERQLVEGPGRPRVQAAELLEDLSRLSKSPTG